MEHEREREVDKDAYICMRACVHLLVCLSVSFTLALSLSLCMRVGVHRGCSWARSVAANPLKSDLMTPPLAGLGGMARSGTCRDGYASGSSSLLTCIPQHR
jgi:hypothetical protein